MSRPIKGFSPAAIERVLHDTFGLAELRDGQGPVIGPKRREKLLRSDRAGVLTLRRRNVGSAAPEPLVGRCHLRSERDQTMLERMVAYAQSGRCRWNMVLEHLETDAAERRCMTCDHCFRLEAHEVAARTESGTASSAEQIVVPKLQPVYAPGQPVRTRRHGTGTVVSASAVAITVRFANDETRTFQPQYVGAAKARGERAAAPPRPSTVGRMPVGAAG